MIGWDKKYPCYEVAPNKVRAVGMAMSMQGSGISNCDVGTIQLRLNDDGFYTLMVGCSDMWFLRIQYYLYHRYGGCKNMRHDD